jgi:phospho-N-acetylmuramoyl-pentapeptide-transferase
MFLLVGINNSVNLTDGIHGLCSSITAVIAAFCAISAFLFPETSESLPAVAYMAGALFGGCLGFLVYNWNPARIFMGDTGSLFLGGFLSGLSFLIGDQLLIIVVGLWFVMEAVSVILQVGCYKLTKKRIFKMAPIHHHFEKCGWSEIKIVIIGIVVTAVLSVLTYFLM